MSKDVKFNIRLTIDGKEQIVTASTNVKQFAQELEIARTESTKLRDDLLKITQVGASFQNALTGVQQLTGLMRTFTAANAMQVEAETKLANNMRNTMGAREEEIQGYVVSDVLKIHKCLYMSVLRGFLQTFLHEKRRFFTYFLEMQNYLRNFASSNTGSDARSRRNRCRKSQRKVPDIDPKGGR